MTTQIKRRRGTTTQHASFTGAEGELTIDTTKDTVVVHDGSTAGGHPLAKASEAVAVTGDTMTGALHVQTASAGTVTASAQADDLIVENSTEGGMTIITPDDQSARIRFTSPSTNNDVGGATIFYRQNINKMNIGTGVAGGKLSLQSGAANETMILDGSGRVGIGVTAPDNMVNIQESALAGRGASNGNTSLTLEHATDTGIQFFSATQTQLRFGDAASTGAGSIVYAHSDDSLRVSTNGSEAMRISSSGSVGIGTASPDGSDWNASSTLLHLYQNSTNGALLKLESSNTSVVMAAGNNQLQLGTIEAQPFNFYTSGTERMRISSSGSVGIGTSSPNSYSGYGALTINGTTGSLLDFEVNGTVTGELYADSGITGLGIGLQAVGSRIIHFKTNNQQRMHIDAAGDYLFLGGTLRIKDSGNTAQRGAIYGSASEFHLNAGVDNMVFTTSGGEAARIDSSGNLSIGSAEDNPFNWSGSSNNVSITASGANDFAQLSLKGNGTGGTGINLGAGSVRQAGIFSLSDSSLAFATNATNSGTSITTRMTIDSSGALLVGKTAQNSTATGSQLNSDGLIIGTRSGYEALLLNRKTSQGSIATFQYENAPVGSIGVSGGNNLYISGQASNHSGITFGTDVLIPTRQGAATNNITDLGASGNRFKDLHLSGTIEIQNGTGNVGVGESALNSNTGNKNTAVGISALYVNTGAENTAVGYTAGASNTTNSYSTFIGKAAGYSSTGAQNTYLGEQSGYYVTSGAKNTILGRYNGNQGGLDIRTSSNNIVLADGDGTPRGYFDSSGHFFVGCVSIPSGGASTGFSISSNGGIQQTTHGVAGTSNSYVSIYRNANGLVGGIRVSGSGTSYDTSSDYRLKENVVYDWDATTRLKQLKPARFNFIADASTTLDGFLAHEAQAVVPECASGTHNEVDDDGNPVYQGIDQSKLVPLLVKTIQELEARITALENA